MGLGKTLKKGIVWWEGSWGRWKLRKDWGIPVIRIHDIAKE